MRRSKLKTSTITESTLIRTGAGQLHGFVMTLDGTNDVTIVVYDNTSGAGTTIVQSMVIPGADKVFSLSFEPARVFSTGLYVKLTCAGTVSISVDYMG